MWAAMLHLGISAERRAGVMRAYEDRQPHRLKSVSNDSADALKHLLVETPDTSAQLARVIQWYDALVTITAS
jgi:hypothetical protein